MCPLHVCIRSCWMSPGALRVASRLVGAPCASSHRIVSACLDGTRQSPEALCAWHGFCMVSLQSSTIVSWQTSTPASISVLWYLHDSFLRTALSHIVSSSFERCREASRKASLMMDSSVLDESREPLRLPAFEKAVMQSVTRALEQWRDEAMDGELSVLAQQPL